MTVVVGASPLRVPEIVKEVVLAEVPLQTYVVALIATTLIPPAAQLGPATHEVSSVALLHPALAHPARPFRSSPPG